MKLIFGELLAFPREADPSSPHDMLCVPTSLKRTPNWQPVLPLQPCFPMSSPLSSSSKNQYGHLLAEHLAKALPSIDVGRIPSSLHFSALIAGIDSTGKLSANLHEFEVKHGALLLRNLFSICMGIYFTYV